MIYSGITTSVKTVIAKVYRDLQIQEEESFIDFVEWSAEALEKIGTFNQLEAKPATVEIHNYKGVLPDGFVYPIIVSHNNHPILPTSNASEEPIKIDINTYPPRYSPYPEKYENATFVADSGFEKNRSMADQKITYNISNGYIKVGFPSGKLKIVFACLPLDCDGLPLIPDYVEFKEAVYWYINMKYSYAQWRRGSLPDRVYMDAEKSWHWYCQQAANKARIPDLPMMESMKRSYLSLKPRINEFMTSFNNLNTTY